MRKGFASSASADLITDDDAIESTMTPSAAARPHWRTLSDRELGILAGLFDGEGCITASLTSQNRLIVRAAISMTTREEVARFANAFGGSILPYDYGKNKPFFTFSAGNGAAVDFLEFVVECCRLKAIAAAPALALARDMQATPPGRAIPTAKKAWRLELAEQIVAAVGRRPDGFEPARVARYLEGRTYSGQAVVSSDGKWYASMNNAGLAMGVTGTAICTAVRRNLVCCGLTWAYAVQGSGKPDDLAAIREQFSVELTRLGRLHCLTASGIARWIGVTEQAASAWHNGITLPTLLHLAHLLQVFGDDGLRLAEIYGGMPEPLSVSPGVGPIEAAPVTTAAAATEAAALAKPASAMDTRQRQGSLPF